MKGYLGEIRIFTGKRTPHLWAKCDGKTMKIKEYPQLFEIIGNTYGGDGETTFTLPDLSNRFAVGAGESDKVDNVKLGQKLGKATVVLNESNLPPHDHQVILKIVHEDMEHYADGIYIIPRNAYLSLAKIYNKTSTSGQYFKCGSVDFKNHVESAIENYQPFVACSHIICIGGTPPILEE